MRIVRMETTASTNADARLGVPGDVFVAEFQTAGRGRLDHRWQSRRSENLTFSIVLADGDRPPAEVATLPLVVGLAVAAALQTFVPAPLRLKWPNDILADGRKVSGILCERCGHAVIAGVGINVNQTDFPPEISDRATSLARLAGRTLDREAVLAAVLASVETHHARWCDAGFAALYGEIAAIDDLKGRTVSVRQTDADPAPLRGVCGGIAADGTLCVAGTSVYAGEAHVTEASR